MPAALFLSPHLDDAVFSCGGTLWRLGREPDWTVTLATVFTASVPAPRGFALRCQTDKGLGPEVDYLRLRRAEDRAAAGTLGVSDPPPRHGGFAEAPHRGYGSAPELFAGTRADDAVWRAVSGWLRALVAELAPALVFVPQGLGNHVDHLQVIRAVLAVGGLAGRVVWYRDTPYAIREPAARPVPELPAGLTPAAADISGEPLARKVAASQAYTTQVGFQFGGDQELADKLGTFHRGEAKLALARSPDVTHAERFLAPPGLALPPVFFSPTPEPPEPA